MEMFLNREVIGASKILPSISKRARVETFNADDVPEDPGCRKKISNYPLSIRDEVRRVYLQRGPCQPRGCEYPQVEIAGVLRRFNPCWYDKYPSWLEYSLQENKLFCLFCYLFKIESGNQAGGDVFVITGFQGFNKIDRLRVHIGGPSSAHNQARIMCEDLLNQNQSIQNALEKQTEHEIIDYTIRLRSSVSCIRYLLCQGLAFRGHDESEDSSNKGNFLELLKFLAENNKEVDKVVLRNAPRNLQLTSPDIQKQIVHAAAKLTTKAITDEIGDDFFSILVDESCDISEKEQMALVIRYVTKGGNIVEHFLGVVHVEDTSALSLKEAIISLLGKNKLNLSRARGQGYDGASNMRGEFNGLKALILRENQSAYYIHCFAHQLQLTHVYIAKSHEDVDWFFELITRTLNVVGGSAKRRDMLRKKFDIDLVESRSHDDLQTGRGLNQELGLKRPGDTRWGSHYRTILNFISNFSSLIHVLEWVGRNGSKQEQRNEANRLKRFLRNFDFIFCLLFMKNLLGLTNELSLALQRKDQDILNAMSLVRVTKM
jgi:Domain of unknown function (DUF4371)